MKILFFEDDGDKYCEVSSALQRMSIKDLKEVWAKNLEEGLRILDDSLASDEQFDLIITDMQFPLTSNSASFSKTAGEQVIAEVQKRNLEIQVILCSSANYHIKGVYESIWYSPLRMWENDLRTLIQRLKLCRK